MPIDADDMRFMNNDYYETENTHTGESETESETDDEWELRCIYIMEKNKNMKLSPRLTMSGS